MVDHKKLEPQTAEEIKRFHGFSDKEYDELVKFRASLPIAFAKEDSMTLMRFLRARKFNIHEASLMYLKAMHWRQQNQVDQIYANPPPNWDINSKVVVQHHHSHDKEGRPVYFHRTGGMHLEELMKFSHEAVTECHIYAQEHALHEMKKQTDKLGKSISQFTVCMDMDGLGIDHRKTIKFMKYTSYMDQNFYPETLYRMVFFNAPRVAPIMWKLIKPFLDPVTQSKVVIVGGNYKEELLKLIDSDCLPVEYGGTCNKCNGKCVPNYTAAEVAEWMKKYQEVRPKYEESVVKAGAQFAITLNTDNAKGAVFRYQFTCKKDIDFWIEFYPLPESGQHPQYKFDQKEVEAHTVQKSARYFDTNLSAAKGTYVSRGPGMVRFVFDNAYSRFTAKEIRHFTKVEDPYAVDVKKPAPMPEEQKE